MDAQVLQKLPAPKADIPAHIAIAVAENLRWVENVDPHKRNVEIAKRFRRMQHKRQQDGVAWNCINYTLKTTTVHNTHHTHTHIYLHTKVLSVVVKCIAPVAENT